MPPSISQNQPLNTTAVAEAQTVAEEKKLDSNLRDTIIMPEYVKDTATYHDIVDAMKNKGYRSTVPVVGEKYRLGDAELTIISLNGTYSDPNNNSVGIILRHGKRKLLFTGDAEEEAEAAIIN